MNNNNIRVKKKKNKKKSLNLEMGETKGSPTSSGGIKVICAGLGRTGTLSLTEALEILGYKPYHYIDFNHASAWEKLAEGSYSADDVIDLIVQDGYDAVLENPTCDIYRDFMRRFPDAKVILTVRDTPEMFETSWKTLFNAMTITEEPFRWSFPSPFGWVHLFQQLKKIRYFMGTTHLQLERGALTHGWKEKEEGWLAHQYQRHNQDIIDHVPKGNLLVFNVKEGWKPLTDFLGCDVPVEQEFPHSKINTTKSLKKMRKMFLTVVYGWIPGVILSTAGAYFLGQRMICKDKKH
jgi:hypothetical protein